MENIVYYIGAGASCFSLPLVANFEDRMLLQIQILYAYVLDLSESSPYGDEVLEPSVFVQKYMVEGIREKGFLQEENIEALNKYLFLLSDFAHKAKKHASIDTLAKKLLLTSKDEYEELKNVLTVFLTIEQTLNPPDPRYDAFFASILGESAGDLPKNVTIVSWNYDLQFELTFMRYLQRYDLKSTQEELGVITKGLRIEDRDQKFRIYKVNGSTCWLENPIKGREYYPVPDWKSQISENSLDSGQLNDLMTFFKNTNSTSRESSYGLSFSWEKNSPFNVDHDVLYKELERKMRAASDVVIIGYSFPFFNREIDNRLFAQIDPKARIYFQTKYAADSAKRLKGRYSNLGEVIPLEVRPPLKDKKWDRGDLFFVPTTTPLQVQPEKE